MCIVDINANLFILLIWSDKTINLYSSCMQLKKWRKKMKRTIHLMAAIISISAWQTKGSENQINTQRENGN